MADQSDVRRIALALPEVVEDRNDYGFTAGGKKLAWLWRERVDVKKPKVVNPEVLVVRVADEHEKRALIAANPEAFFTEPHYDGFKAVLVRLPLVGEQELTEVLTDGWRSVVPPRLLPLLDADA